ncbi:DUF692 domain-containing protein [Streptomyces sp. MAR4 CNX-425]|uniref:DUF692 domain-containing protein n=1 Tax=Streptomyces sp. MAR4 CNX-425 TaxID=3406343 RepID=UPI003B500115
MSDRAEPPRLGVGLGYRKPLHEHIVDNARGIDWLEVITDQFLYDPDARAALREPRGHFPLVPHGLEMSVGSQEPLDEDYLRGVVALANLVDAPWASDHLCFTRGRGLALDSLNPVVRTVDNARHIAGKAQQVQDALGRPFLLENITYYVDMPGELTEAEMITEVMEHCTCGILLDLSNVLINAGNHGFDPYRFLDELPLERVEQVHLAGSSPAAHRDEMLIDRHDHPLGGDVLALFAYLLERCDVKAVLMERDDDFPEDFQEIVADLDKARQVVGERRPR